MEPRIIKSEQQYREYLAEVDRLATEDPAAGTSAGDRLELLAKLVEDYEKQKFAFDQPDPVDAILFRMEEQNLQQKDLAPLLGGKNRVSEILSRKRPLTLQMIRSLSKSLKIPVEVLVQDLEKPRNYEVLSDIREPTPFLEGSSWLRENADYEKTNPALLTNYLKPNHGPLYLRRTITYGATPETNKRNLQLWVGKVRELASARKSQRGRWKQESLNEDFLLYVARLSWSEKGPAQAQSFLAEKGIALVMLPALPQTKLDGAAMLDEDGAPIIGLTARHDRLDNFWFTLLHELVHAWKHLNERDLAITDESIEDAHDDDAKEAEANRIARDTFIPRVIWKRSDAFLRPSSETICALADKLHISPAIVAGRVRREKTGYALFGKLVGNKKVRTLFPDIKWT